MNTVHHVSPPFRVHCGEDSLKRLPDELDRLGCTRAVVFCGGTVAHRTAGLDIVAGALGSRCAGVFEDALGHIAEHAFGDWFLHQNPRRVSSADELLELLAAAW